MATEYVEQALRLHEHGDRILRLYIVVTPDGQSFLACMDRSACGRFPISDYSCHEIGLAHRRTPGGVLAELGEITPLARANLNPPERVSPDAD